MRERILDALYRALDEVNLTLPDEQRIVKAPETPLLGALDSMDLVNLVVEVETAVQMECGRAVDLTGGKAAQRSPSPFANVAALADYIEENLGA